MNLTNRIRTSSSWGFVKNLRISKMHPYNCNMITAKKITMMIQIILTSNKIIRKAKMMTFRLIKTWVMMLYNLSVVLKKGNEMKRVRSSRIMISLKARYSIQIWPM